MDEAWQPVEAVRRSETVEIVGPNGARLAGLLDLPAVPPRAFALVAHCFVCGMNLHAAAHVAERLTRAGIGVLRFDFTGIGNSPGEFDQTDFASNVDDLVTAAEWLRREHAAPQLLIGHSLGGSAALVAARRISEVNAVVTIGAPAETYHVTSSFQPQVREIEEHGSALVQLGARRFRIGKHLLDSLRETNLPGAVAAMAKPLLILHSPRDEVVSIDDARRIYDAARHPKSFVALDGADHFLIDPAEAAYAGDVIAAWAERYLVDRSEMMPRPSSGEPVTVAEAVGADGSLLNYVAAGAHQLLVDEPVSSGGGDAGPSPYELLSAALGACTSMTLRLYAARRSMDLHRVQVDVDHLRGHAVDCAECVSSDGQSPERFVDTFRRRIRLSGNLDPDERRRLLRIAEQCPVHRTLSRQSKIETELVDDDPSPIGISAPADQAPDGSTRDE